MGREIAVRRLDTHIVAKNVHAAVIADCVIDEIGTDGVLRHIARAKVDRAIQACCLGNDILPCGVIDICTDDDCTGFGKSEADPSTYPFGTTCYDHNLLAEPPHQESSIERLSNCLRDAEGSVCPR